MRTRIKKVAVELLIKHGYRGLRFGDIATRLGTTRANVHYHFGTKQRLVEEVIDGYLAATLACYRPIWLDERNSFQDKIRTCVEFNRQRYRRFNRRGERGKPWSLITRMRGEREVLSRRTNAALHDFGIQIDRYITSAIEQAKAAGELGPEAPVRDLALQLACIVNSAASITRDTGGFEELEQVYEAFARLIHHAYARQTEPARLRAAGRSKLARVG